LPLVIKFTPEKADVGASGYHRPNAFDKDDPAL
jgi:hypothetical protein